MGRAMLPDPGDQITYESGSALAGDRFEHVALSDSVDPWESTPSWTAVTDFFISMPRSPRIAGTKGSLSGRNRKYAFRADVMVLHAIAPPNNGTATGRRCEKHTRSPGPCVVNVVLDAVKVAQMPRVFTYRAAYRPSHAGCQRSSQSRGGEPGCRPQGMGRVSRRSGPGGLPNAGDS